MNPLDVIVADGARRVLEEDLGRATYCKVEKAVYETHASDMRSAASDFAKLDLVLRRFFGRHAANIELKMFKRVIMLEERIRDGAILGITEQTVSKVIFESYGDSEKRAILDAMRRPATIPDVIRAASLPKASTYGRIKELLDHGLLSAAGRSRAGDGRSVNMLQATLRSAVFDVGDRGIKVRAGLGRSVLDRSFAYNSIVQTGGSD